MRRENEIGGNKGFAMTGVIVLLFVLTFMGAAMYGYSMTSLRSVRYLSDQKKADYLARAGVEAASYAYKLTVDSDDTNAVAVVTNSSNDGDEITTSPVYLIYQKSTDKYTYVTESEATGYESNSDYIIIGWYEVVITNKTEERTVNFLDGSNIAEGTVTTTETTIKDKQRQFKCTGHAMSGATATKQGYMSEPVQGLGTFYDSSTGIIDGSASGTTATNDSFSVIGTYTNSGTLSLKTNYFGTMTINVGTRTVPIVMGYSSGNLILNEPDNGTISFKEDQDNMVTFAAINDLFVKSDIDVTSTNGHFNIMTLKGNNIVVNGDIEISVYGFTTSSASYWYNNISTVINALSSKYRLSTVVISTPDFNTATVTDPINTKTTSFGRCGRIYFGGDVYVNITSPNVGTYRYKAFSAGDAYYFQDSIDEDGDGVETQYSIDLLKYFLDDAIANKKYSENVLSRFQDIIDMYYTTDDGAPTPYVQTNPSNENVIMSEAMRKIDRDTYGDSYLSLVPPDPTDASTLRWG